MKDQRNWSNHKLLYLNNLFISANFFVLFTVVLYPIYCAGGIENSTRTDCSVKFSTLIKIIPEQKKFPRPAEWITGKIPTELEDRPYKSIHKDFFERNKFDRLTSKNFDKIETDIRAVLSGQLEPIDRSIFNIELATVISQNRPTPARVKEANHLLQLSVGAPHLPPNFRSQAKEVELLVAEMMNEAPVYKPLRQINWAISNECPLCCKGCYFNFRSETMTMAEAKNIASKLKTEGVKEIILTGGDPALSSNFLQYVDMLHDMGFKVAVDTTGYTMTEDMARHLAGKLSYVGLPVDGPTQEIVSTFRKGQKDTLEKVLETIRILKKFNIPVKINTTVTQYNVEHLDELAKMLVKEKVSGDWGWSVFQWWDTRAEEKMVKEFSVKDEKFLKAANDLLSKYPELHVRVGSVESRSRMYFEIMTNGDVLNYSTTANPGSIIIGNANSDPIKDLILSPALDKNSPKFKEWFP